MNSMMNELYDEWMDSVMNELLWDVWVDICNCVCNVLYYILICVFVFQGQIKPLYGNNKPHETYGCVDYSYTNPQQMAPDECWGISSVVPLAFEVCYAGLVWCCCRRRWAICRDGRSRHSDYLSMLTVELFMCISSAVVPNRCGAINWTDTT